MVDACLASLAAQTEARHEVLVLDDGSTDDTRARLAAWVERDPRIRPVETGPRGLVPALNALAAAARAPVLARMDADDVAREGRLAAQLDLLDRHPEVAVCGTGVRYFPRALAGTGYRRYETWINGLASPSDLARDLLVECPIAHPTLMVRTRVFRALGGYRDFDGPEDYDLVLRIAGQGHALANVPEVLLDWRLGPGRLSETSERYSPEAFRKLKVEYLAGLVSDDARIAGRPLVVWGAGRVGKSFVREWLSAGNQPFSALVDLDPRKIGQQIHEAPVISPSTLSVRLRSSAERPFVLIAVGSPGARGEIREALAGMGVEEIADYRAIA